MNFLQGGYCASRRCFYHRGAQRWVHRGAQRRLIRLGVFEERLLWIRNEPWAHDGLYVIAFIRRKGLCEPAFVRLCG